MGITRKHHAMGLSGRGSLAGRFTRNVDYNGDDYGDGLIRIPILDHLGEENHLGEEIWDWEEATTPPPGYAWKKSEVFDIWVYTWGYNDQVPLGTAGEFVDKAYANGWIITIAEWEAMGEPTYVWSSPITEGPFSGYVMKVGAITGSWVAPTEWYSRTSLHTFRVDAGGNVLKRSGNDARFAVGRKFLDRAEMFAWADSQNS